MHKAHQGLMALFDWLGRCGFWVGFIFIYMFDSVLLTLATSQASSHPALANRTIGIMLIYSAFLLAFISWRYHKQLNYDNPRRIGQTPFTVRRVGQLIALFCLMYGVQIIWSLLIANHVLSSPANQTAINQQVVQLPFWNLAYSVCLAPVIEELIFRGIFLNYFFRRNNRWMNLLGVLVSGLIFGYMHVGGFSWTLLMYSALGWVLGFTYLYFKDIRYSIALHFMNNALSLL
ncbi:CPBP family intramembrane glutamic endopeptidase [Levilactobacillus suantsaii]|uniref:CPBP family intramembrane metalloprotease n=1 Tax=Levilactobacillus suantsaii TaxID=2292255 RepID=A0A4Q0VI19_9LACO|nr:type II CAAX endopeptidase family protein [Levilactobacillus suantsaii]QMU08119.1 CPBP family intramembrane metalloprotease [Levilactobacillus suantsaii]RXI79031.1 CPBP family intramembrane metalloprotease [Levilactobacillus suantsaii]